MEQRPSPLLGPDVGPQCKYAPHLYLVTGDIEGEYEVVPYSAQHCCMDHGAGPCYGWVCLHMDNLKGMLDTCQSEVDGGSQPASP